MQKHTCHKPKKVKNLAAQDILTYCTTRILPYHLYADGFELFVLTALLTSGSLSKKWFFDKLKKKDLPGKSFFFYSFMTEVRGISVWVGGVLPLWSCSARASTASIMV